MSIFRQETSMTLVVNTDLLHAGFLFGLFFDPEDGVEMFL
jgi:hypothetical protein